jgi:hypothetical protein
MWAGSFCGQAKMHKKHKDFLPLVPTFEVISNISAYCLLLILTLCPIVAANAVDLVRDGKPVAEIIVPENPTPGVKAAADELQRHLEAMSGAKLAIVTNVSSDVKSQVYVGESDLTRKLGVTIDDIQYDGFKIVARDNHVVVVGRDIYHFANHFARFKDVPRGELQKAWEDFCGRKWKHPYFWADRLFLGDLGFHLLDATGTLYATYDLLEQLGWRWYMPGAELGIVAPKTKNITVKDQNLVREPYFPQRKINCNCSYKDEFLWYKSMKMGVAFVVPVFHFVGRVMNDRQVPEYFGKINGKVDYYVPRLDSERLKKDCLEYLECFDKGFPGIGYSCLCQPDGWSAIDSRAAAAGWDKLAERGPYGRFSDYSWDFSLDMRRRVMERHPDRKFTVFAYSATGRRPANADKIPDNMTVVFHQTSPQWMIAPYNQDRERREEWLKIMSHKDQMLVLDMYLEHAPIRNFPPAPVIYTRFMQENFREMSGHCMGFIVESSWSTADELQRTPINLRRPGLSHLMLYLHSKYCWEGDLDLPAVLEEYYGLFFGPAGKEMKEYYEFAEEVWIRPEPRQITVAGGFLKPADVNKYFEILTRARAKAGDTIYGKRVDLIAAEMEPLKVLFEKLKRTGPAVRVYVPDQKPVIDGDLEKPFWREQEGTFLPLRDMITGEIPKHVGTSVSFRWLADDSALVVGIECREPKMDKLCEGCRERDSAAIFKDDTVEIRLETATGSRPFIVINPAGTIYDECATTNAAELPQAYTVKAVAVKKYPDRWTVEARVDAKPIGGERPTPYFPWGVQINRQRMAGNTPEHYMLSPTGTNFKDLNSMGNLSLRK